MKDICIIANFTGDFDGSDNNRFNYLADRLSKLANVELITSTFSHTKKRNRNMNVEKHNYKVTLVDEPNYKRNISIKRIYSHYIFSLNVLKYLASRKKPDVIYCSIPSIDLAYKVAKYAKKNNIRFLIDIQDLWPEQFQLIIKSKFLGNFLFFNMKRKANYAYKFAESIISVSETYLKRGLQVNTHGDKSHVVYLGTDLTRFDQCTKYYQYEEKTNDEFYIGYVGTLGHSYDIKVVMKAISIIQDNLDKKIIFLIMGDGPLKNEFADYAKLNKVKVEFTGRIPYCQMVGKLKQCKIVVNPIKKGAAQSIINKHADYAAVGLPIVNTQESDEYQNLIRKYNCGINCVPGDSKGVAEALLIFLRDDNLREIFGRNSRKMAEEIFNREKTYDIIVKQVLL